MLKWIRRRMRIAPDYDGERLRTTLGGVKHERVVHRQPLQVSRRAAAN
jgi:hypothetical protein